MTEENTSIIPREILELRTTDEAAFKAIAASSFLDRLQLFTAMSDVCKSGVVPVNQYGLVTGADEPEILGKTVDVAIIAWRPLALDISDGVQAYYRQASADFVACQQAASTAAGKRTHMFGPQFLVYVPSANGGAGAFAGLFCGSPTARRMSPDIKRHVSLPGQPPVNPKATLGSKEISNKEFTWYGMTCTPCSTSLPLPPAKDIIVEATKFLTPPESEIESAPVEAGARER